MAQKRQSDSDALVDAHFAMLEKNRKMGKITPARLFWNAPKSAGRALSRALAMDREKASAKKTMAAKSMVAKRKQ